MGTIKLMALPSGSKAIPSKWVFKIKKDKRGEVERLKARMVARGDRQRPGFDYTETFAPTPRPPALRATFAIAAIENLELHSMDVTAAFLNGDLDEEIYMRLPEGMKPDSVVKLQASIYGLKQGARQWLIKLHSILSSMGFECVKVEQACWTYGKDETHIIIPTHIDDMTTTAKSLKLVQWVKQELAKHVKIRDLGETKFILGVEVIRDRKRRAIGLTQRQYIEETLKMFGLESCSPVATPLDPHYKFSMQSTASPEEIMLMSKVPFATLLGRWAYLCNWTRPDAQYACSLLARAQKDPKPEHWKALKHLSRYLAGTRDMMLIYAPDPNATELFTPYSDSDYAGDSDSARSTSGMVMKMGTGAISWSSKLQPIVALLSTEAEYVAVCQAGQEAVWVRQFLEAVGYDMSAPTTMFVDNKSAVCVARNPEHQTRMKHIDVRWHWLRECVEKKVFKIEHIRTDKMPADILTKALSRAKVETGRRMLGLARTFAELLD